MKKSVEWITVKTEERDQILNLEAIYAHDNRSHSRVHKVKLHLTLAASQHWRTCATKQQINGTDILCSSLRKECAEKTGQTGPT
jgi:hypothetical protein